MKMLSAILGQSLLGLALHHYVDNFIGIDKADCAEHANHAVASLVRILLSETAISVSKFVFGNPLDLLGVTVALI